MRRKTERIRWSISFFCSFLVLASAVEAKVYKCVDAQGGVEYSQIPCAADQESHKVFTSTASKPAQKSCAAVSAFAKDVAERMRSGTAVESEIDSNGGLNGISKPALNIINYVYSFRVNEQASKVRIASLVQAKCSNGAFGNVEYIDLPQQYDPDYKADDKTQSKDEAVEPELTSSPTDSNLESKLSNLLGGETDELNQKLLCEQLQQQMDAIGEKKRRSYSNEEGDLYRQQERELGRELRKNCK